jgi:hypothetical protein
MKKKRKFEATQKQEEQIMGGDTLHGPNCLEIAHGIEQARG